MKILVSVFVAACLVNSSFAQERYDRREELKADIVRMASQIAVQAGRTYDFNKLMTARNLMQQAVMVLDPQTPMPQPSPVPQPAPQPQPNPGNRLDYRCIPRDDDGRAPFVISIRNNSNYEITKIRNLVFNSMDSCQLALNETFYIGNNLLICSSRDEDGRNPYSIYYFDYDHASKIALSFNSYPECKQTIGQSRVTRSSIALCASRDNDGRSPWAIYTIDQDTRELKKTSLTYSTLQECIRNL